MSKSEAKRMYNTLKSKGELKILFPDMTGDWSKDQKEFQTHFESANEMIDNCFNEEIDGEY